MPYTLPCQEEDSENYPKSSVISLPLPLLHLDSTHCLYGFCGIEHSLEVRGRCFGIENDHVVVNINDDVTHHHSSCVRVLDLNIVDSWRDC